jgi:hypothetical protein
MFAFENEIKQNMNILNQFMVKKKINKKLQDKIKRYLDYYWRE